MGKRRREDREQQAGKGAEAREEEMAKISEEIQLLEERMAEEVKECDKKGRNAQAQIQSMEEMASKGRKESPALEGKFKGEKEA
jgi:hypothetical protein